MSLKTAVQDVVKAMEEDVQALHNLPVEIARRLLTGHIRSLNAALTASEDVQSTPNGLLLGVSPAIQHEQMIAKAREEMRLLKQKTDAQESYEGRLVECVGGPAEATMIQVPGNIQDGHKTVIAGAVYILKQGKPTYSAEETTLLNKK